MGNDYNNNNKNNIDRCLLIASAATLLLLFAICIIDNTNVGRIMHIFIIIMVLVVPTYHLINYSNFICLPFTTCSIIT